MPAAAPEVSIPPAALGPWFAVTMTVRNNARTLPESLGSILPQLEDGGELVVVDALSEDGTRELLADAARRTRDVTIVEEACNRGVGRNVAVRTARASVILTQVDGDNRYAPAVLRAVAQRLRGATQWDAAFAVGEADWDPSSTRFYAWKREAFLRAGGYEERQEREDPPLLLRAFRAGLRIERVLLPKVADDLKPRLPGLAPSVPAWRRSGHSMWAARKFRVMGYRYSEYRRLLRLTRRSGPRYLAALLLGGVAYLQGAVHGDGPEVFDHDDAAIARAKSIPGLPPSAPGGR